MNFIPSYFLSLLSPVVSFCELQVRALVIDDSRAVRRLVGSIVRELGYEVIEAEHGLDGLAQLERYGIPDLILVDWNMPEMNGLEFIKAVRANPIYSDVLMLMVTTETEMTRMAEAFVAGVNEYIMKPFDKAIITEKLQLLGVGV